MKVNKNNDNNKYFDILHKQLVKKYTDWIS